MLLGISLQDTLKFLFNSSCLRHLWICLFSLLMQFIYELKQRNPLCFFFCVCLVLDLWLTGDQGRVLPVCCLTPSDLINIFLHNIFASYLFTGAIRLLDAQVITINRAELCCLYMYIKLISEQFLTVQLKITCQTINILKKG